MSDVTEVKQARRVAVWDPLVRYVAVAVAAAYLSGRPGPPCMSGAATSSASS
jgi:hypothetical protein